MTDPIVEHAKATLEIVDLLQAMMPDCKCEARHLQHLKNGAVRPAGECSVLAVARSRTCRRPQWFLVCDGFVEERNRIKAQGAYAGPWFCSECKTDCWELVAV